MVGTEEIQYPGWTKTIANAGIVILSYQGLEDENLDQESPGPPGCGLMYRTRSSLITKKQKMLKNKHQASKSRLR